MAWINTNKQYTINGLSGSTIKVVIPVGEDNGTYCGTFLKLANGGHIDDQLQKYVIAKCPERLRQPAYGRSNIRSLLLNNRRLFLT